MGQPFHYSSKELQPKNYKKHGHFENSRHVRVEHTEDTPKCVSSLCWVGKIYIYIYIYIYFLKKDL